jgi:MFS family permease
MSVGLKGVFGRFPHVFWVVQLFELMERGAYYTMMPILVVHAAGNVGMNPGLALILPVFMYPFQYGLPIFSGPYAEKLGYKLQMSIAFLILSVAYLYMSFANNDFSVIVGVILIGLGIGIYKPLISATVAKCTSQKDRNMAFGIYYLVVNIAAATFPIVYVVLEATGIITKPFYYYWVFRVASVFFIFNLLVVLFVFKEVPRSGGTKTVGEVVNNIKIAFADKKFVIIVILVGAFWALYSSFLTVLPLTLMGFRLVPDWFDVMLLGVFNPGTIILAGPWLLKFSEKIESVRWLIGGVFVYVIGLAIIGLTLQIHMVILGIIVASIGEFMVAPGFLSFTSKLAPKEQVPAYVGATFVSTLLGITIGTLAFGVMADYVAITMRMPNFNYGIMVSMGLLLLVLFVLYNRAWGKDIVDRAKRIEAMEEGVVEKVDDDYKEPVFFKLFDHRLTTIIPLILIPVILVLTYSIGTKTWYGVEEEEDVVFVPIDWSTYTLSSAEVEGDFSGTLGEGASAEETVEIDQNNLGSVTFTLQFPDEPDADGRHNNQPDVFSMDITYDGESIGSDQGPSGSFSIKIDIEPPNEDPYDNNTGEYMIEITCVSTGDHEPFGPSPFNLRTITDNGNDWTLSIEYEFYEKPE